MKRLLAISDIHGCYDMFLDLWDKVHFHPKEDVVIFLGDYIDRGSDSAKMMEWILAHQNQEQMIFLRGNHEVMMYDTFRSSGEEMMQAYDYEDSPKLLWKSNGGGKTTSSMFREGKFTELLSPWLKAVQNMRMWVQLTVNQQTYFFAHAGININRPLDQQRSHTLYWSRELALHPETYEGDAVLVFGHTPVQSIYQNLIIHPLPLCYQNKHVILLDTGSYMPGGKISCMDILTGKTWQSYANQ